MSRVPSTDLFDLIKSLTKSEKRQFKLFASRQRGAEKNRYVELFDAVDKQQEYDEELLIRQNPWLEDVNFRSMKSYLYELTIRSLWSSSVDRNSIAQVQYLIDKVALLSYKELYSQAARVLAKVKKIAMERQYRVRLLAILDWESRLNERIAGRDTIERHQELHEQLLNALDGERANVEYYNLLRQVMHLEIEFGIARDKKTLEQLDSIMSDPLLKEGVKPITLLAEMYSYETHIKNCRLRGDVIGTHTYMQKKLRMLDDNFEWSRTNTMYEYLWTCNDYLTSCLNLNKFEEYEYWLDTIKGLDIDSELRELQRMCLHNAEFSLLVKECQFDKGLKKSEEIEGFLRQHGMKIEIPMHFSFYSKFALLNIAIGDYRKSLFWISRTLDYPDISSYASFQESAKLLEVISYFELGETRGLESAIRSLYRYLRKKDRLHPSEAILLQFLQRLPKVADKEDLTELFHDFRQQVQNLERKQFGVVGVMPGMNMELWLESKMKNVSMAELMMQHRSTKTVVREKSIDANGLNNNQQELSDVQSSFN